MLDIAYGDQLIFLSFLKISQSVSAKFFVKNLILAIELTWNNENGKDFGKAGMISLFKWRNLCQMPINSSNRYLKG